MVYVPKQVLHTCALCNTKVCACRWAGVIGRYCVPKEGRPFPSIQRNAMHAHLGVDWPFSSWDVFVFVFIYISICIWLLENICFKMAPRLYAAQCHACTSMSRLTLFKVDVFLIVFVYPHTFHKDMFVNVDTLWMNLKVTQSVLTIAILAWAMINLVDNFSLRIALMWDLRSQYWANINLRTNYVVKGGNLQPILRITLQWNIRSQYWATYHLCRRPKPGHKGSGRSNKSKANTNRDRTSKPHKQENKLQSRWHNLPEKYYYILKCSELEWMVNFTTAMLAFE